MAYNLFEKDAKEILMVNAELGIWTNLMLMEKSDKYETTGIWLQIDKANMNIEGDIIWDWNTKITHDK